MLLSIYLYILLDHLSDRYSDKLGWGWDVLLQVDSLIVHVDNNIPNT